MNLIVRFLVQSNLFVSICVLFLTWGTAEIFDTYFSIYHKIFVTCSTLLVYNLHRFFGGRMTLSNSEKPFVVENIKAAIFRSSLPFIAVLYSVFFFKTEEIFALVPAAILSTFYVGDLFFRKSDTGLRAIPFIKIFIIAFVWTVVTAWFPLTKVLDNVSLKYVIVSLERFFFILAITIPFDIRDLGIDNKGLRTIPQILGIKKAKWLSIFFLLTAASFSSVLFYLEVYGIKLFVAAIFLYLGTLLLIAGSGEGKSDYYYSFWIEGTMLAWGAILLIF